MYYILLLLIIVFKPIEILARDLSTKHICENLISNEKIDVLSDALAEGIEEEDDQLDCTKKYDALPTIQISLDPPSRVMIMLRRIGIAVLLTGLRTESFIKDRWLKLKKIVGYS